MFSLSWGFRLATATACLIAYLLRPGLRSRRTRGISTPSRKSLGRRKKVSQVCFSLFKAISFPLLQNFQPDGFGKDRFKSRLHRHLPFPRPLARPRTVVQNGRALLRGALALAVARRERVGAAFIMNDVDTVSWMTFCREGMKHFPHVENIHVGLDENYFRDQRPPRRQDLENLARHLLAAVLDADHRHVHRSLPRNIDVEHRHAMSFEPALDRHRASKGGDSRTIVSVTGRVDGENRIFPVCDGGHSAENTVAHLAGAISGIFTVGAFESD